MIIVGALLWLGYVMFLDAHTQQAMENTDQSKIVITFAGVILVALVAGVFLAMSIVSAIGDWMGNVVVNPGEQAAHDPHNDAQARVAQGDYEGAIRIFLEIFEKDPADVHALSEAGRLHAEKRGDIASAAAVFENALQAELPHEQSAFIANKLVDVYWNYQGDAARAKGLLAQIIETMPETKYAANALHRVHEIDRALLTGHAPKPPPTNV